MVLMACLELFNNLLEYVRSFLASLTFHSPLGPCPIFSVVGLRGIDHLNSIVTLMMLCDAAAVFAAMASLLDLLSFHFVVRIVLLCALIHFIAVKINMIP